jgi:hypothetical protein
MTDAADISSEINKIIMRALGDGHSLAGVISALDHQIEIMRIAAPIASALANAQKRAAS